MADAISRLASEFAALDPEYITQRVHADEAQQLPFGEMFERESFTGPGSTFTVPSRPNVTFNDVTESATVGITAPGADAQAFAFTARDIVIGQKACDVAITLKALLEALGNLPEYVAQAMSDAYWDKVNTDFMSQVTDASAAAPDHEIGSIGTPLDFAVFLLAHKLLWKKRAKDISCIIGVDQIEEALTIPEFTKFLEMGRNTVEQKRNPVVGELGITPFGSRMVWSLFASTSGGATGRAIVADKKALAFVEKMPFNVDINATQLKNGPRVVRIGGNAFYGVGGRVKTALNNDLMVEVVS